MAICECVVFVNFAFALELVAIDLLSMSCFSTVLMFAVLVSRFVRFLCVSLDVDAMSVFVGLVSSLYGVKWCRSVGRVWQICILCGAFGLVADMKSKKNTFKIKTCTETEKKHTGVAG